MDADLIVLGATAGGCAAALEARRLGRRVLLVEDPCGDGGTSFGPRSAYDQLVLGAAARSLSEWGSLPDERRHTERLFERARAAIAGYLSRLRRQLENAGVEIVSGRAEFVSPSEIALSTGDTWESGIVVVATGSIPRKPERFPFDGALVCDPGALLTRPGGIQRALVVGAEGTGCEVATIVAAAGVSVALLDRRSRLLRSVDREIRERLHAGFQDRGVEVILNEGIVDIEARLHKSGNHVVVRMESGRVDHCDCVVIAAGEVPATGGIHIDRSLADTDPRGFVIADEWGRTSRPGVFAVGRVSAFDAGTSAEWCQGRLAALTAIGADGCPGDVLPTTWRTVPLIASVGLTDEACEMLDVPFVTGKAEYADTLWANLNGMSDGLVKIVSAPDGGLLGAHVIGQRASEVIDLAGQLLRGGETLSEIAGVASSSGGIGEIFRLAAADALDRGFTTTGTRDER